MYKKLLFYMVLRTKFFKEKHKIYFAKLQIKNCVFGMGKLIIL